MSAEDDLKKLIERLEAVIPYVTATLSAGNTYPSKERSDWVEVHAGRAHSSREQLAHVLEEAKRMKAAL